MAATPALALYSADSAELVGAGVGAGVVVLPVSLPVVGAGLVVGAGVVVVVGAVVGAGAGAVVPVLPEPLPASVVGAGVVGAGLVVGVGVGVGVGAGVTGAAGAGADDAELTGPPLLPPPQALSERARAARLVVFKMRFTYFPSDWIIVRNLTSILATP